MNSKTASKLIAELTYRFYWEHPQAHPRAVNYWRAVALTLKGLRKEVAHG